jgi:ribonuclease VapC
VSSVVLDSSAVLALILNEPGGQHVDALLDRLDRGEIAQIALSALTWCEILSRLHRNNDAMTASELAGLLEGVEVVSFTLPDAELAADFARMDCSISLGDRACLALARTRNATAWTTDKVWQRLNIGVTVKVLR